MQIGLSCKVHSLSTAVLHGLAYIINSSKQSGHLVSPTCIHMVLQENDLVVKTNDDWKQLGITDVVLRYIDCEAQNVPKRKSKSSTPRPGVIYR